MRLRIRKDSSRGLRWGKLSVLFVILLAIAVPCLARQVGSTPAAMTGVVRTSEGTPVPGATVRLVSTDTNKVWLSWTDESGKFEFPQIATGHYRIETSQLGFVQTSLVVEIPAVPPGPIPIVLRVATLAELSATPATASPRTAQPGANRARNAQNGATNSASASGSTPPGSRRGNGGGQL